MKSRVFLGLMVLAPGILLGQPRAPSHGIYDQLLSKHVAPGGKVNYRAFVKDTVELNRYLSLLSAFPPDEKSWSRNEQMAFWINAYNAYTIKLITKFYPLKSIKDIGSAVQIPFVNTPWDLRFIHIGKFTLDLNQIEHGILRKNFKDPRIHMALVCASKSCPPLLNEAYDPRRLDEQLTRQTLEFLKDPARNQVTVERPKLNMIFQWYALDFRRDGGSVTTFVNKYSEVKIRQGTEILFLEYDWTLNGN